MESPAGASGLDDISSHLPLRVVGSPGFAEEMEHRVEVAAVQNSLAQMTMPHGGHQLSGLRQENESPGGLSCLGLGVLGFGFECFSLPCVPDEWCLEALQKDDKCSDQRWQCSGRWGGAPSDCSPGGCSTSFAIIPHYGQPA